MKIFEMLDRYTKPATDAQRTEGAALVALRNGGGLDDATVERLADWVNKFQGDLAIFAACMAGMVSIEWDERQNDWHIRRREGGLTAAETVFISLSLDWNQRLDVLRQMEEIHDAPSTAGTNHAGTGID